jgi:chloramphenicol 3-O phosphotransferase
MMDLKQDGGKIILINGASSAGKSTLARALWGKLKDPFLYYSFDHFRSAEILPMERIRKQELDWPAMRPAFFEGFHRSLAALASAGNNLLVEHIVETEAWMDRLLDLLAPFDVFFIGVHCPLPELERREAERGDRRKGEARADYAVVHDHKQYDLELSSTEPADRLADLAWSAWRNRRAPGAFEQMANRRVRAKGKS